MKYRSLSVISGVVLLLVGCGSLKGKTPDAARFLHLPSAEARKAAAEGTFTLFETGQVRPLALSPNGNQLFAANTPDNRLEVFSIIDSEPWLRLEASVPVGLEPIAVAARSQTEVWVVNHLSDSVSIVDLSDLSTARVVRTIQVGDEPRDIVFGGPAHNRAFITTAHRGQRLYDLGVDPQLTTPSIGRADVWVFNADNLGDPAGGTPVTNITLFCDTPRALAVTPDGSTVYAAAFNSGNQTTTIGENAIDDRGLPPPTDNFEQDAAPSAGLIVKFRRSPLDDRMHWLDERNVDWDNKLRFSLPDRDVFAIDATATPPVQKPDPDGYFSGVGTVLFNMAVNPRTGKVYVSNTDARNDKRFEGRGMYSMQSVRGHLAESRITVLNQGQATPHHLNKHIDYGSCCAPIPNPENQKSLAFPGSMVISNDGQTLYVAAFGSSKVGIFGTARLEDDTFVPDLANQIAVSGGGPSGLALDEVRGRLYVMTRFDNSISAIDTLGRTELFHVAMSNPEPASITNGRRFLYDASLTSSHGDSACASCHIFGDFDALAWDLGDPDGTRVDNFNPFELDLGDPKTFHPMKGPMTTQSLRGMDNHGPMHWRGDRTGAAVDVPSVQPNSGAYDEDAGFKKFNVAFEGLVGRDAPLTDQQMQDFTSFVLQIMYPPNPIRQLDNSLTAAQQRGRDFYFGPRSDQNQRSCNECHVLDPDGNRGLPGVVRPGFFGTEGKSSEELEPQKFKIAHLRNVYQKVGMFGMAPQPTFFPEQAPAFGGIPQMGDQIRGFGMLHDGSVDSVFRFHGAGVFVRTPSNPDGIPFRDIGFPLRRDLEAFVLAFDSNLAPIVGQQVTLTQDNLDSTAANDRINLFENRAVAGECDLVVKGYVQGVRAAFLYNGDGTFTRSVTGERIDDPALRAFARDARGELTFTCVPPGNGSRIADEL